MRHDEHPADRPGPAHGPLRGRRRAVIALLTVIIVVDLLAVGSTLAELELPGEGSAARRSPSSARPTGC